MEKDNKFCHTLSRVEHSSLGDVLPTMDYTTIPVPKGVPFFRLEVCERMGISRVVLKKRVRNIAIYMSTSASGQDEPIVIAHFGPAKKKLLGAGLLSYLTRRNETIYKTLTIASA